MELCKKTIYELSDLISKKEVKAIEVVECFLQRIEEIDNKIGAFLYIAKEEALEKAKEIDKNIIENKNYNVFQGIPIGIKDNINVLDMQNTCGSKMLEDYIASYDATVIEKLKKENFIILGKTNMDEFAMGSSNEKSAFKNTKNPWNLNRVTGGSSGGSAAAVSSFQVPVALGTETGGSVRQPASFNGIVGLKPTYGRISRYGVTSFASTLDQVGIFSRKIEDCAALTNIISGVDNKDFTTINMEVKNYRKNLDKDLKGKVIGIPKEFFKEGLDCNIKKAIDEAILVLKDNGAKIKPCSIPLNEYALPVYYILSSAEASSNLSRFDGIRYGKRADNCKNLSELYIKSRSKFLGTEVKERILLGTYVLSKGYYNDYYEKALKIRELIKIQYKEIFKEVDCLLSPTTPTLPFKLGEKEKEPLEMYLSDIYTVPANIVGIPAISIPCGVIDNLPVGMQLMGNYFSEELLFNIGYKYEKSTNWHKKIPFIKGGI